MVRRFVGAFGRSTLCIANMLTAHLIANYPPEVPRYVSQTWEMKSKSIT